MTGKRVAPLLVLVMIVLVGIQVGSLRREENCVIGHPVAECVSQLGSPNEVLKPSELEGGRVHIFKSTRTRGHDLGIVERDGIVIEVINIDSEYGKDRIRSFRH